MKTVRIKRFNDSGADTLGAIFIDGKPFCLCIEQEWNDNKVGNSCIPKNEYLVKWHESPKYGWCYLVEGVPNRSHILFHKGNTAKDTRGCILPGEKLGTLDGRNAVLSSKWALDALHQKMQKADFKLIVE